MRKLGAVGFAIVGVVICLYSLNFLASMVGSFISSAGIDGGMLLSAALFLVAAILTFAVGFVLIAGRERFAARLFGDDEIESALDAGHALWVGLVLLGVFIAAQALGSLVGALGSGLAHQAFARVNQIMESPSPDDWWSAYGGGVVSAVRLVAGLAIVVFSRSISARFFPELSVSRPPTLDAVCASCGAPYSSDDYREDAVEKRCSSCGARL